MNYRNNKLTFTIINISIPYICIHSLNHVKTISSLSPSIFLCNDPVFMSQMCILPSLHVVTNLIPFSLNLTLPMSDSCPSSHINTRCNTSNTLTFLPCTSDDSTPDSTLLKVALIISLLSCS